jgi:hypothetical protein
MLEGKVMSNREIQRQMLKSVATALGPDLSSKVSFVGGQATGLQSLQHDFH